MPTVRQENRKEVIAIGGGRASQLFARSAACAAAHQPHIGANNQSRRRGLQEPPMTGSPVGRSHTFCGRPPATATRFRRGADVEGQLTAVGRPEGRQRVLTLSEPARGRTSGESSARTKTREMPSPPKPANAMARPSGEISRHVPGAMVTSPGGNS